jgi:hypothetical protein
MSDHVSETTPFQDPLSAREWIMRAIDGWWSSKNAIVYSPYLKYFSFNNTPSEILYSIYHSCVSENSTELRSVECANIEIGMAEMLSDPAFLSIDQEQQLELLSFAGMLKSPLVLGGFTHFVQNLPVRVGNQGYALASEALFQVRCSGYEGEPLRDFLRACRKHVGPDICVETMLLQRARHDPKNWTAHLTDLAAEFAEYLRTSSGDVGVLTLDYLVQDLVEALGKETYIEALNAIPADVRLLPG